MSSFFKKEQTNVIPRIEKGIPYTPISKIYKNFPLVDMEVGDSFVVSKLEIMDVRSSIQTYRAKLKISKETMKTFRTKKIDIQGNVRVWRIE